MISTLRIQLGFSSKVCSAPHLLCYIIDRMVSQVALVVKNPPANAGDLGLIPGLGRSPGEGNGDPLQYSCLENPMDRGTRRGYVHEAAKSWTQLK